MLGNIYNNKQAKILEQYPTDAFSKISNNYTLFQNIFGEN